VGAGDLAGALRLIDEWIGASGPSGVGAVVWRQGQIVAERYAGEAQPGVPVEARTIFPLASVTKPVTAAVVMTLVDEGRFSLDEPVTRLVPEFRAGPSGDADGFDANLERLRPTVSVRQLLCHTSGLPEDLGPRHGRNSEQVPLSEIVDAMCHLPLGFAPGSALRYSNVGYGVITRLVERVTGQDFWEGARRQVLTPMRLRDTVARPDRALASRIAELADASNPGTALESYNSDYWRGLALPWGGLYGTPRDLARFAGAFLPSGAAGPLLLSPPSMALMTSDQAGVAGGVESLKTTWEIAHWGLGWEVKGSKRRHWTGELTSPATFCHFGAAGTLLWADPKHDIALAVFGNRAVARIWTSQLPRWARLSNAVIAAATR
jgi:beta-lactamase class C